MQHEVLHGYRHDDALRASFNRLAKETFGLDFEPWYQNGFWNDKYDPHSILIDGEIVANVSVNRIDGLLDGTERHYVQLGTVMTKPEWRRKGLIRKIMQAIQAECAQCDGLFLYAGDDVCGFYPKFGFVRAPETRYRLALQPAAPAAAHSVPMATPEDWQAYLRAKRGLVSAAAFAQDTDDLHMFYLTQFMQDCLYFLPELGAYVVASAEGNAVEISEVLAPGPVSLRAVCEAFGPQYSLFTFGFTPKDAEGLEPYDHVEEDCTFFVQGEPLSGELRRIGSFPAILHA